MAILTLGLFISQTLFATGLKLLKATENHHSQYHGLAYSIQLLMKKKNSENLHLVLILEILLICLYRVKEPYLELNYTNKTMIYTYILYKVIKIF